MPAFILFLVIVVLTGCASPQVVPLMPTPVVYTAIEQGPLDHIPDEEKWKPRRVYFATTRARSTDERSIDYTNSESDSMALGMALVGFGGADVTWSDLSQLSRVSERDAEVPLSIAGLVEAGRFTATNVPNEPIDGAAAWLMADLNAAIASSRDDDLLIYVHGAKVDFYNACAYAAQLDHFLGRDITSLAFSWPTRQNILAYGSGADVARAYRAADSLVSLLDILSQHSAARRIHIVSWSAGGRVVSSALQKLRDLHEQLDDAAARERLRIGTLYFAASDLPGDEFIDTLPAMNALADRVLVTASTNDGALNKAKLLMGGETRIGAVAEQVSDEDLEQILAADRLEVIDVSRGSELRGFDITGHRYWLDHPWASSDMILAIRSNLQPGERALEPTQFPMLWAIPADYPERLAKVIDDLREPRGSVREDGQKYCSSSGGSRHPDSCIWLIQSTHLRGTIGAKPNSESTFLNMANVLQTGLKIR